MILREDRCGSTTSETSLSTEKMLAPLVRCDVRVCARPPCGAPGRSSSPDSSPPAADIEVRKRQPSPIGTTHYRPGDDERQPAALGLGRFWVLLPRSGGVSLPALLSAQARAKAGGSIGLARPLAVQCAVVGFTCADGVRLGAPFPSGPPGRLARAGSRTGASPRPTRPRLLLRQGQNDLRRDGGCALLGRMRYTTAGPPLAPARRRRLGQMAPTGPSRSPWFSADR